MMQELDPRAVWPGWTTIRLIGRGSYGAVYEIARDVLGETERAALKLITVPQSSGDIDELYNEGYDEESITRTFRDYLKNIVAEYTLMRKMNGSSNVVNCDDVRYVQHDDGFGWDILIKMELLTPLAKTIGNTYSEAQVIRIGEDICRALVLCKKYNIVHRDIKPQNIFVSDNGDYKLGDFGIAKTIERTMSGTRIGTYESMAPEVYLDQPYGHQADIYSLGTVLYWLMNNRRTAFIQQPPALPTAAEKEWARRRRFAGEPFPAPANGSPELQRIVLKACAYRPADRYQTAEEMLRDLEALAMGQQAAPAPSYAQSYEETVVLSPEYYTQQPRYTDHAALPREEYAAQPYAPYPEVNYSAPPVQPYPAQPAVSPAPAPAPKKKKGLLIGIAAAVLAVLVLAVFVLPGLLRRDQENTDDPQTVGIWISEAAFPDEIFREYISDNFDTDNNGVLSESEIAAVEKIVLWYEGKNGIKTLKVASVEGIEFFTKLQELDTSNCPLTSLDLSKNTELVILCCSSNKLTNLNVSKNEALTILLCGANQLTSLDVSKCTNLEMFSCAYNQLTSLDISKNTALTYFHCEGNQLTSLDLSHNTKLEDIDYSDNPLSEVITGKEGEYTYIGHRLTISGANSTGTMYAAAAQVAATFTENINGMNVSAATSTGSSENARIVNSGETRLGMCSGDTALDAVNGTGKFAESGRQENICAIGAVYPNLSNWIARKNTGWKYLHDADPKGTYGVGPSGSISESSALLSLEIAGISTANGATFKNVTFGDGANNVADGNMAASTAFSGIPVSAHQNAAAGKDCVWLGFTEEELDRIVAGNPAYYKAEIPAGTYEGQDAAVSTFGTKIMLICNRNLDEEVAYQMAKTLYEQAEKMAEASGVFFNMRDKSFIANDLPIRLHPGAERFYKEVGILVDKDTEAQTPAEEKPLAGTYQIRVWTAGGTEELTKRQISDFNTKNGQGIRFEATVESVSEADAPSYLRKDFENGADLYCFPQNQYGELVNAGVLSMLNGNAASIVNTANDSAIVSFMNTNGSLYAYPLTADNGYFMYYDKTVIPESDIDSLEKMIADCEAAGRTFAFDLSSAWYLSSFFLGTGCVSEWKTDGEGRFVSVNDTFNSEKGLIAVKGMKKLLNSSAYRADSSAATFDQGAAVVVSGTWDYNTAKDCLGENLGIADLPSFEVDGTGYHLGSYSGYKLMGVKPQTDPKRSEALHLLAQYLTGEECQKERFYYFSWGPANLNAQKNAGVQSDLALAALMKQNLYATPSSAVHGSWWAIAAAIAADVQAAEDEAGLRKALSDYSQKLTELLK